MPDRLPVLISIPHGGDQIPSEVENSVLITKRDIFNDGDPLTREIYNFADRVEAFIEMPIARAVIDLNRAHDDRPPENPDGVVKTITTDKTQIYKQNMFPDDSLIEHLLEKYYFPFHKEVDQLLDKPEIKLALDCHSMLEKAPVISKEPGEARPLICLSNRGDFEGKPRAGGGTVTCPPEWIGGLADSFRKVFGDIGKVAINRPFIGGYNSLLHFKNKEIPWIQVEINRSLYLNELYFNEKELSVGQSRLIELREMIFQSIELFINKMIK
jgi:formiminoglutamase